MISCHTYSFIRFRNIPNIISQMESENVRYMLRLKVQKHTQHNPMESENVRYMIALRFRNIPNAIQWSLNTWDICSPYSYTRSKISTSPKTVEFCSNLGREKRTKNIRYYINPIVQVKYKLYNTAEILYWKLTTTILTKKKNKNK